MSELLAGYLCCGFLLTAWSFFLGACQHSSLQLKVAGNHFWWLAGWPRASVGLLGLLGLESFLGKFTPGTKSPCLKDSMPVELMGGKLPINEAGWRWGRGRGHNLLV